MFDKSTTPPESTPELVDGLNDFIAQLRSMKVESIQLAGLDRGLGIAI